MRPSHTVVLRRRLTRQLQELVGESLIGKHIHTMSRVGSPERGSVGAPSPSGSPDRGPGAEASPTVPTGTQVPTTPVFPWTLGEPIQYAPLGFPGVGAASGPVTMGALGKGFGFNIGSGPKGDSHIHTYPGSSLWVCSV